MKNNRRWRGLVSLVADAVQSGSAAVERIQKETVARPFALVEKILPRLKGPAEVVRAIHDVSVSTTHGIIRSLARTVAKTVDGVLETIDHD